MLMYFRISNSDSSESVESNIQDWVMGQVQEIAPSKKVSPIFRDSKQEGEEINLEDIEKIIKRQMDISIEF